MNITRLPSGKYRIRQMYKGVNYSLIVDEKPTKAEATRLINEQIGETPDASTFEDKARAYIAAKSNVLSGSTKHDYIMMLNNRISDNFKKLRIDRITQEDIQVEINNYAVGRAPKTVANYHGFISAVISFYRPTLAINTRLPQPKKFIPYIPTDDEVSRIVEYFKDTDMEVPIWLGVYGLRRSEVCALDISDLSPDNMLTINKALVYDENGKYHIKYYGKTTASAREIALTPYIADLIRERGEVCTLHIEALLKKLKRCQKELNIPAFRLHDLRHYFATVMTRHFPDKDVQYMGGWATDNIMKTVYAHAQIDRDKEAKKRAADMMQNLLKN